MTQHERDGADARYLAIWEASDRDPEFRARLVADPRAAMAEQGVEAPEALELRVAVNDAETMHIVFPPDPNAALSDDTISSVSGGVDASTASSVGCVGSVGSFLSTVSTAATVASLGSAGCQNN